MNTSPENPENQSEANAQPGSVRRSFIKRTTATLPFTVLALNQFRSEARAAKSSAAPSLHIYRDGVDVTDKTTEAFSGETVTLTAVVKPNEFRASNWAWAVPNRKVKDFKLTFVNGRAKTGERIDYKPADLQKQSVSIHWIDGGSKTVKVSARIRGRVYSVFTTVAITRPDSMITATRDPDFLRLPFNGGYFVQATIDFAQQPLLDPGTTHWVQTLNLDIIGIFHDGSQHPYSFVGKDGCGFPNSSNPTTADGPAPFFIDPPLAEKRFKMNFSMWLMYLPPKPGIYVPLRKMNWWYRGKLRSTGPTGLGNPPAWIDSPDFDNEPDQPTFEYPKWTDCKPQSH